MCWRVKTIPHAHFGTPSYPLFEESRAGLQQFLDGQFTCERYWKYLTVYCFPSYALCLSFFAITMDRLCRGHLDMLELQAKTNVRLADVEKGLAIAATMQIMGAGNWRVRRRNRRAGTNPTSAIGRRRRFSTASRE